MGVNWPQRRRISQWIGYLSTTGVYGDRDGAWVDETSALTPSGERGRRRLMAEQAWAVACRSRRIFSPGRHLWPGLLGPRHGARRQGAARGETGPGFQPHPCGGHRGRAGRIDGATPVRVPPITFAMMIAAPPADVVTYACELLGVDTAAAACTMKRPISAPMARSFYDDNKRVRQRSHQAGTGRRAGLSQLSRRA